MKFFRSGVLVEVRPVPWLPKYAQWEVHVSYPVVQFITFRLGPDAVQEFLFQVRELLYCTP